MEEVQKLLEHVRRSSTQGDVRGAVKYLVGILAERGMAPEEAGTSRRELASLVRCGLIREAIGHLEMAETMDLAGLGMNEVQVAAAMDLIDTVVACDGPDANRCQAVADLLSIFGRAEAYAVADEPENGSSWQHGSSGGGGCAIPFCTHDDPKKCVLALNTLEAQQAHISAEKAAELDRESFVEIAAHDPFAAAVERMERGDATIRFLLPGSIVTEEDEKIAEAPFYDVHEYELVAIEEEPRRTVPPPLPFQRHSQAAGEISLHA